MKSVRWLSRLLATIGPRPSRRSWGSTVGTQTMPLQYRIIMFTASAVACEAAMIRSPSFSRPSSSVTMTRRPAAISATADSTESKVPCGKTGMMGNTPKSRAAAPLSMRRRSPRRGHGVKCRAHHAELAADPAHDVEQLQESLRRGRGRRVAAVKAPKMPPFRLDAPALQLVAPLHEASRQSRSRVARTVTISSIRRRTRS